MMDWMARTLELPKKFLSDGEGGGVIQVRLVKICVLKATLC